MRNLQATDDLGRALPTAAECGPIRRNRQVGIFYFMWGGENGKKDRGVHDISKILSADPSLAYKPDSDVWGGDGVYHHWGESIFGYYFSRDEWVMRKHIEMLTHAGVDFIIADVSILESYIDVSKQLLRLLSEYRAAGFDVPKVVFYTWMRSGERVQELYEAIYKPGYMRDSWYYMDGKPFIIAEKNVQTRDEMATYDAKARDATTDSRCTPETLEFFTMQPAQWPTEPVKTCGWPWVDFRRPQIPNPDENGNPYVVSVSCAQNTDVLGDAALYGRDVGWGRAFHDGARDRAPDAYKRGGNFQEQWDRAIQVDAPFVFVTSWNEWKVEDLTHEVSGLMGRDVKKYPLCFLDHANTEFSRDCEPMRGGFFDNYYMQLIANIRRYKGAEPTAKAPKQTIRVDSGFEQWDSVSLTLRDFPFGATKRDSDSYIGRLSDDSGRNEIVESKACWDDENVYFYARCASPITPFDNTGAWMRLYLSVPGSDAPNWRGYAYIANFFPLSKSLTTLAAYGPDGFDIARGTLPYRVEGDRLMLAIPRAQIGLADTDKIKLQFKWADSKADMRVMEDFYAKGDCAPIGRLNYVFEN